MNTYTVSPSCGPQWSLSAMFVSSSDSSPPPLIGGGGGLVCESVGKAEMLSTHLMESSRETQKICHPLAICLPVSLPLSSGHGRWGTWGGPCWIENPGMALTYWMCSSFLNRTADVLAPLPAVVSRLFLRLGAFLFAGERLMSPQYKRVNLPPQWEITDTYAPITETLIPILSIVFEHLVSVVLGVISFSWNANVCFQSPSSLIRKVLVLVMPCCAECFGEGAGC